LAASELLFFNQLSSSLFFTTANQLIAPVPLSLARTLRFCDVFKLIDFEFAAGEVVRQLNNNLDIAADKRQKKKKWSHMLLPTLSSPLFGC
jgi:hypothetical protein